MKRALDLCEKAADAIAAVDLRAASADSLAAGALGLQCHIDRMKALHAQVLIAADNALVWQGSGARNISDWLARETNTSYGDAISRTKLGESLEKSPELADAVCNGEITAATAETLHDAITQAPFNADVSGLINSVKGTGPREARQKADFWKENVASESEEDREERHYQQRAVWSAPPVDGMVTTTVLLPVLESRQFISAITHIADKYSKDDPRTTEQRLADGLVQLCKAYSSGQVTGGRESATLLVTVPIETLTGHGNAPGVSSFGDRIPAHVVRRLAEDAHLQRVITAGSRIFDFGRKVRFATDDQYKALVVRDGGCRYPGCQIPAAWCEVDHLTPFPAGGRTDLDELVLWCDHHHHFKHKPGVKVHGNAHNLRLQLPNGDIIECPTAHQRRTLAAA